jgi:hypothetical protein
MRSLASVAVSGFHSRNRAFSFSAKASTIALLPWFPVQRHRPVGTEREASLDAQQIARTAGTIPYNVLCGINVRVKRFYTD